MKSTPAFVLFLFACALASSNAMDFAAHRGANQLFPENSVESARAAWAAKARYVEGDFHLTNENKLVCMHGEKELAALTGSPKKVPDLTAADLAALTLNANDPSKKAPVRIPLLIDLLRTVPKSGIFVIEIKTYGEAFPSLVEAARTQAGLSKDQILLIAFNAESLADFARQVPGYRALWLCKLKMKNGKVTPDLKTIIDTAKGLRAVGVDIGGTPYLTRDMVDAIHRENLLCWTWTTDEDAEIARLKSIGVDVITTNRIHEVLPAPVPGK